jgi:ribosome-binding factor A
MTTPGIRPQRVAAVVQETVTEVLVHGGIRDARVSGSSAMITVTHVRVADDLGVAWIFVSVIGGDPKESLAGLRAAGRFLRGEVAKRLRAKRLPELRFELDTELEREARVEAAFREIELERRARAGEGAAGGEAPVGGAAGATDGPDDDDADGDEDDEDDEDADE